MGWLPERGAWVWRSGLTSTHSAAGQVGGGHDRAIRGPGLLSQIFERGRWPGSGYSSSSPGGLATPAGPVTASPAGARVLGQRLGGRGGLGIGEQVPGAGEQLAGDRRGGDLLPASLGDGLEGGSELRGALGGLRRLAQHPAQPHRALFPDVPVVGDAVAAADGGRSKRPSARDWPGNLHSRSRCPCPASSFVRRASQGPCQLSGRSLSRQSTGT